MIRLKGERSPRLYRGGTLLASFAFHPCDDVVTAAGANRLRVPLSLPLSSVSFLFRMPWPVPTYLATVMGD